MTAQRPPALTDAQRRLAEEVRQLGRVHAPWYFEALVHQRLLQVRPRRGFKRGVAITLLVLLGALAVVYLADPFGITSFLPRLMGSAPGPAIVDSSQQAGTPTASPDSALSAGPNAVSPLPAVTPSERLRGSERNRRDQEAESLRPRRRQELLRDSSSPNSAAPARRPGRRPADSSSATPAVPGSMAPPDTL